MKFLSSLKRKDLAGKICLLRDDFNVVGNSDSNLRLISSLPTIKFLTNNGAKAVVLSHKGRPAKICVDCSLKSAADFLGKNLKKKAVFFEKFNFSKIKKQIDNSAPESVFLLENLRFLPGEEKNSGKLAKQLASLGDFYVNDAFGVSHRKAASISAITKFLPSYAGLLLEREIKNLSVALKKPKKPLVIILGGAKISGKLDLIDNFLKKADYFLAGGGIANTFIAAMGLPIGNSLYEKEMILFAKKLLKTGKIILPVDFNIRDGRILDIGPKTIKKYADVIKKSGTIIWNGPVGYI